MKFLVPVIDWLVLAQAAVATDPTGLTGWIAAGSTVGLLGPVLYWLCYVHLPKKDTQLEKLVADHALAAAKKDEDHRKQVAEIVSAHDLRVDKLNTAHESQIVQLVSGQREVVVAIVTAHGATLKEQRNESREALRIVMDRWDKHMAGQEKIMSVGLEGLGTSVDSLAEAMRELRSGKTSLGGHT